MSRHCFGLCDMPSEAKRCRQRDTDSPAHDTRPHHDAHAGGGQPVVEGTFSADHNTGRVPRGPTRPDSCVCCRLATPPSPANWLGCPSTLWRKWTENEILTSAARCCPIRPYRPQSAHRSAVCRRTKETQPTRRDTIERFSNSVSLSRAEPRRHEFRCPTTESMVTIFYPISGSTRILVPCNVSRHRPA